MNSNPFSGRSLQAIRDFNPQERLYLYAQTRRLKEAVARAAREQGTALQAAEDEIDRFRINDPDFGLYEIFLEDSTRTRESFKNAAHFHRIKVSELNAGSSSFNKKESYADTIANLVGYDNSVFVLRTALEGVCRHLSEQTELYRQRHSISGRISFINAGDGRHEHPTQELLDEFTFLEDLDWSAERIHLALVGDLYHGRTVHSKVHGLDLFSSVRVDLVAPPELAMPERYVRAMEEQGFVVRSFHSIAEYLEQRDLAPQWYFTRPQLERMGERILNRQEELRGAITFTPELVASVPERTRFYHPLPRHREHPTLPRELDNTALNAWERQSANGYFVRIVLLAMVAGRLGSDYTGPTGAIPMAEHPFIREVPPGVATPKRFSEGVRPIRDGLVLDHICSGDQPQEIRRHMATLQVVADLNGHGGEWISQGSNGATKGILFRPGFSGLEERHLKLLAAVVPGCTVNIVEQGSVVRKVRLSAPPRIWGIPGLSCGNPNCITSPVHGEGILPSFIKTGSSRYACEYCSHDHDFKEIWR